MGKISDYPLEFWIDPITLDSRAIWKRGPYLWRFHERDPFQPPGVRLGGHVFEVWMVDFAQGGCEFLDEGDVIQYGNDEIYPIAVIAADKFADWKKAKQDLCERK